MSTTYTIVYYHMDTDEACITYIEAEDPGNALRKFYTEYVNYNPRTNSSCIILAVFEGKLQDVIPRLIGYDGGVIFEVVAEELLQSFPLEKKCMYVPVTEMQQALNTRKAFQWKANIEYYMGQVTLDWSHWDMVCR